MQLLLEQMGICFINEACFSHYAIDCYAVNLHVGFEADGRFHTSEKDSERDCWLLSYFFLPVMHISNTDLLDKGKYEQIKQRISIFVCQQNIDANKQAYSQLHHRAVSGSQQNLSEHLQHLWLDDVYRQKTTEAIRSAANKRKHPAVVKKCEWCGKEMFLSYKHRRKRFCNNSCASCFKWKQADFRGKVLSDEMLLERSDRLKRLWQQDEFRTKSSRKGKHHSAESREKLRKANLGKHHDQATKEKISIAVRLTRQTPEVNDKARRTAKELWKTEEYRSKQKGKSIKGKKGFQRKNL